MVLFTYDKSFDGFLTTLFFAYQKRLFPDYILGEQDAKPLLIDHHQHIVTNAEHAQRVWRYLENKLSAFARKMVCGVWLSELEETEILLFRYLRKNIDAPDGVERDFGDSDVLRIREVAKKVSREAHHLIEFLRFQETRDGLFFATIAPEFNTLQIVARHFEARFTDRSWLICDVRRGLGILYDQQKITPVTLSKAEAEKYAGGVLAPNLLSAQELKMQKLWKEYFSALAIRDRVNPRLQRQHMPRRYWKYMTEMQ